MTTRRKRPAAETSTLMQSDDALARRRLENWRQTERTKLAGVEDAPGFIDDAGVVTLFPASPEIPNLFHAYMGDPDATIDSSHDSPSGEVYTWRWTLGRQEVAFYGTIVRNRPTWVSWSLVPAVLRLRGELRQAEELYRAGELSAGAYRIAEALRESGGVLATGDLRREAGFPTGKANRAAYLKALDELDRRLMVAKVFAADSDDMSHALVRSRYPELAGASERLTRDEALARLLHVYLPNAVYANPATLAKHLGLAQSELQTALARLLAERTVIEADLPGQRGTGYVWQPAEKSA